LQGKPYGADGVNGRDGWDWEDLLTMNKGWRGDYYCARQLHPLSARPSIISISEIEDFLSNIYSRWTGGEGKGKANSVPLAEEVFEVGNIQLWLRKESLMGTFVISSSISCCSLPKSRQIVRYPLEEGRRCLSLCSSHCVSRHPSRAPFCDVVEPPSSGLEVSFTRSDGNDYKDVLFMYYPTLLPLRNTSCIYSESKNYK